MKQMPSSIFIPKEDTAGGGAPVARETRGNWKMEQTAHPEFVGSAPAASALLK